MLVNDRKKGEESGLATVALKLTCSSIPFFYDNATPAQAQTEAERSA